MTGFEKFCLKLIKRGPTLLSFWGLCPSLDPNGGFVPGPHWDLRLPDHDSMQAG